MDRNDMEKPMPHYTWDQWDSGNRNTEKATHMRNHVSNHVRQLGQKLRNATENTVRWKLSETNNRMSDRISDGEHWYHILERMLEDVKDQIQNLSEAKSAIESTLPDLLPLQEAVREVITTRDRRRDIDLVEDEPYNEIKKEQSLLYKTEDKLRKLAHEAFLQLIALKEQRDSLVSDLNDKARALEIDHYKLSLTPESTENISYKPYPNEIPDTSVDLNMWLQNCNKKKDDADRQITRAMQLANDIWGNIKIMLDAIKKQREVSQRALRKRLLETDKARDKLGAQRKDLLDEIDKTEKEMKEVESALRDKSGNAKLVQTRLENRKWRPRMELCRDVAQDALKQEMDHLAQSKETLQKQLGDIKNNLNCLQQQLHRVEEDLERKERSQAIENFCLEAHSLPSKAPYQIDLAWRAPVTSLQFAALSEEVDKQNRNSDAYDHSESSLDQQMQEMLHMENKAGGDINVN